MRVVAPGQGAWAWSPRRHAAGWAAASLVVTVLGAAYGILLLATVHGMPADFDDSVASCVCYLVPYGLVGAFLLHRRPDLPFGWLLAGAAAALTVSIVCLGVSVAGLHGGSDSWPIVVAGLASVQFVQIGIQGLINVRFPSGRIESRWSRWLERFLVVGLILVVLAGVLGTSFAQTIGSIVHRPLLNPLTGDSVIAHAADALIVAAPLVVLLGLVAGLRIVVLAHRAHGIERQQLRWRAAGVVTSLLLFPLAVTETLPSVVDCVDGAVFVATLAIPVLYSGLWEIDAVIRRSVAYGLVTAFLAGCYLVVAAAGAALASERVGVVVAAFVVALAFGPVRSASQRLVDRLFYGRRNDPYQAVNEVSRRLAAVAGPDPVLPAAVTAVATALRLPYVAIERPDDGALLAAHGVLRGAVVERWPLSYQGGSVGALVAAPRAGEVAFARRDQELLADLARQLGAAVHAEALTADLVESRQRLVNAREDERRRLRRELHDGLGPLLTGLGLNVDAARARIERARAAAAGSEDLAAADTYLGHVKEASSRAIAGLRGIVYGLRPPALDDLGLLGAVRANARRLAEGVDVDVEVVTADLGELTAAVEVAAFRIAVEAVSNTVRHSGARSCRVRFDASERGLIVEVTDDGASGQAWAAGVGLLGMRERAAELGGALTAGPTPDGGQVRAWLPLVTPSPAASDLTLAGSV